MERMSFRAHLIELQRRLKFSLLFWGIGFSISVLLRDHLMAIVRYPHQWAMDKLKLAPTLYVFSYQDSVILQFKIFAFSGFVMAFPFILYQLLQFVAPGLLDKEKKPLIYIYLPAFLLLFLLGALFSYFFLVPYGLYFLIL